MRKKALHELGRLTIEDYRKAPKLPIVVVLDNIRSGHNVGSFFRTADAFRIEKIILTGICPTPPHREIHKTAIGATHSVAWEYLNDPITAALQLKSNGYTLIGIEQTDQSIDIRNVDIRQEAKYALFFGNEVGGLSEPLLPYLDLTVEIPQYGTKHSLNVSVCGGIVLWHWFDKLSELL